MNSHSTSSEFAFIISAEGENARIAQNTDMNVHMWN
jgi:hypothetical protein